MCSSGCIVRIQEVKLLMIINIIFLRCCVINKHFVFKDVIMLALIGSLTPLLYRCNNILYIRGVEEEEEDGEMRE